MFVKLFASLNFFRFRNQKYRWNSQLELFHNILFSKRKCLVKSPIMPWLQPLQPHSSSEATTLSTYCRLSLNSHNLLRSQREVGSYVEIFNGPEQIIKQSRIWAKLMLSVVVHTRPGSSF